MRRDNSPGVMIDVNLLTSENAFRRALRLSHRNPRGKSREVQSDQKLSGNLAHHVVLARFSKVRFVSNDDMSLLSQKKRERDKKK